MKRLTAVVLAGLVGLTGCNSSIGTRGNVKDFPCSLSDAGDLLCPDYAIVWDSPYRGGATRVAVPGPWQALDSWCVAESKSYSIRDGESVPYMAYPKGLAVWSGPDSNCDAPDLESVFFVDSELLPVLARVMGKVHTYSEKVAFLEKEGFRVDRPHSVYLDPELEIIAIVYVDAFVGSVGQISLRSSDLELVGLGFRPKD